MLSIAAVATQGGPDKSCNCWTTQYKLGGSSDGESFSMTTDILKGNSDSDTVVKHFITPFSARYVRLYIWEGNTELTAAGFYDGTVEFRMELYALGTEFHFRDASRALHLHDHTSKGKVGSDAFCNATMTDLVPSFQNWTEGMNGDGNIYASETVGACLNVGGQYHVTAYQRSTTKFVGGLRKELVCFKSETDGTEKCCVNKAANPLGRGEWHQQDMEIRMS